MGKKVMAFLLPVFRWDRPSVFWVFASYLALYWRRLNTSAYFSPGKLLVVLAVVAALQMIICHMFGRSRIGKYGSIAFYLLFFLVFFSKTTVDAVNAWQADTLGHQYVRGVVFFGIEFILVSVFSIWGAPAKVFRAQNIFFTMFFGVALVNSFSAIPPQPRYHRPLLSSYRSFPVSKKNIPLVFIILDGYASGKEVFKVTGDSSVFDLKKALEARNWQVKDDTYSYETSTIFSLASTFNFNLSSMQRLETRSPFQVSEEKLIRNALYDSLTARRVGVRNFGIVDLGDARALHRLYFYPRNFIELLARYTGIYPLLSGDPVRHNKGILDHFPAELGRTDSSAVFYYVHLFMPHSPYHLPPEFPKQDIDLEGYLKFRKFTDARVLLFLQQMLEQRDLRIIITGDHGYREDQRINGHSTFTAYYGFTADEVSGVKSVQDLGSLINAAFR